MYMSNFNFPAQFRKEIYLKSERKIDPQKSRINQTQKEVGKIYWIVLVITRAMLVQPDFRDILQSQKLKKSIAPNRQNR